MALLTLLVLCGVLGTWPKTIGCIVIVHIPKADWSAAHIGLLPSIVRWWMRVKLNAVRRWQTENERPYFFVGSSRSAVKADWMQAARAEHVCPSQFIHYLALLLDLVKAFERVPQEWLVRQAQK